ncbi:hypothetical protein UlMin_007708 [Ulmus minor]
MEGSSSQSSDSNQSPNGASKFLHNLPSRGLFSSTVLSPNPGGMRVYVCVHDTSPPDGQQIKTNQQNILIRSLTLKNKKAESNSKDAKKADGSKKRVAEKALDSKASAKRANSQSTSRQEGSSSQASNRDLQCLTVEKLRSRLKEKGLSVKGKKEELIARLRSANS